MQHNPMDWTKSQNIIVPQVATGDVTSSAIDCLGFSHLQVGAQHGDFASGATMAWKLTECDTSGGSYTDVTGAAYTASGTDSALKLFEVDLRSRKRYLKLVGTYGGTGNAPVAAFAVKHNPDNMSRADGSSNYVRV